MDAHSEYNQDPMDLEDEEKITFITEIVTFFFNLMPFGLWNAGATFQRLMDRVIEKKIDRNAEVYIDDILVRSRKAEKYFADLEEIFGNIRRVRLKLKIKKCTFGVNEGHFLIFRITPEGIKPRKERVEAVTSMTSPRTIKEVEWLNGRVATLTGSCQEEQTIYVLSSSY